MSSISPTVVAIGRRRFPTERQNDGRPHPKARIEEADRLGGWLAYNVAEDPFEPGLIRFAEASPDRASHKLHLQAPRIAPWRQAARECGQLERRLSAYGVGESWEI